MIEIRQDDEPPLPDSKTDHTCIENPKNGNISGYLIVTDKASKWQSLFPEQKVISASEYLSNPQYIKGRRYKIINLCSTYRYLSRGYYCSLLAEARKHRVIPSVRCIRDISSKKVYSLDTDKLEPELRAMFKKSETMRHSMELYLFFGLTDDPAFKKLARELFQIFPVPLMRVSFSKTPGRHIKELKPIALEDIPEEKTGLLIKAINSHTGRRWQRPRPVLHPRYEIAVLYSPEEVFPPSNRRALQKFIKTGKELNISLELIRKKDFNRLAEYDALFIRETTAIEHHTYMFAQKAQREGMVVIDDPDSILRCTNKVFLHELLAQNRLPVPKTIILHKGSFKNTAGTISYPAVLKIPEGSFSRGVFKAETEKQFIEIAKNLFKKSDIILVQEFLYTEYDWRIGVLNGKAIFASKYYMFKKHWQIYNHSAKGKNKSGNFETVDITDAPQDVVRLAIQAANLIGTGLYGVDLKETASGPLIIEINDNPNIDSGIEDVALKDELYKIILREFIRRLDQR